WGTESYWEVWRLRFASNVLAEMIIVPLIVMWGAAPLAAFRGLSLRRGLEEVALAFALLLVGVCVFGSDQTSNTQALLYAPLPILLWAAVRFGPKGLNLSLAFVTFMAIWSAVHGRGPFIENSPEENALSIQLFLILISMPLMFLAAVIHELGRAREDAKQNEARLTIALSAAQMGTWDWHISNSVTKWSDETKRMFGFSRTDPEVPPETFYSMLHPDDRVNVEESINRSIDEATQYEAEFRMPQPDGSVRWIRGKGKVLLDDQGKPDRMIGVNADITKEKNAEMQLRRSHQQVRALAGRLINAQEVERRRLSRELHDDLSQRVAALSLTLTRLKRKLPEQSEILADVHELYKQANDLGNDIRQLSHQLHPVTLEHLGLVAALEEYLFEFERETGISTSFTAHVKTEKIAFEISVCLYRIALEALRNVTKHSEATSASIVLEERERVLTMTIVDSGRGFDVEAAKRGSGIGLISAEERMKLLDGTFEVESRPGEGTKLTAIIALR
ncbi:MAG TPA: PAS domain-containing protein, partial [Pyrinomonadaceae bacterium]|nr:PAS domain-containing protein [Pyrinomonadaceae bacterium]